MLESHNTSSQRIHLRPPIARLGHFHGHKGAVENPRTARALPEHIGAVDVKVDPLFEVFFVGVLLGGFGLEDVDAQTVAETDLEWGLGVGGADKEGELLVRGDTVFTDHIFEQSHVVNANADKESRVVDALALEACRVLRGEALGHHLPGFTPMRLLFANVRERHAATETKDEMECGFFLDIVVPKRAAVLELLAGEDDPLLVRWYTLLVLDLTFNHVNCVGGFHFQCDRFARECFDEYLHNVENLTCLISVPSLCLGKCKTQPWRYLTTPSPTPMHVFVLRCPMWSMCRNSMARVCSCEMLAQQVARGASTVVGPKVAAMHFRASAIESGCECDGNCS